MEEEYTLVDRYLAGELSAQEKEIFEARLKTDTDFAGKVRLYRDVSENLESKFSRDEEEQQLEESLSAISKAELDNVPASVVSLRWYHWAAAASIALLAMVWFYNSTTTLPEYAEYAAYGTLSLTERGADSLRHQAETSFNSKNYRQAIGYLDKLLEADPGNTELKLFKGISLLAVDSTKEADAILEGIKNSNTVYKDKAIWYLALSALKQKDYNRCETLLKELPADSEDHSKAKEILDRL